MPSITVLLYQFKIYIDFGISITCIKYHVFIYTIIKMFTCLFSDVCGTGPVHARTHVQQCQKLNQDTEIQDAKAGQGYQHHRSFQQQKCS